MCTGFSQRRENLENENGHGKVYIFFKNGQMSCYFMIMLFQAYNFTAFAHR